MGWARGAKGCLGQRLLRQRQSHLVKMLRYLWEDYHFADGATVVRS